MMIIMLNQHIEEPGRGSLGCPGVSVFRQRAEDGQKTLARIVEFSSNLVNREVFSLPGLNVVPGIEIGDVADSRPFASRFLLECFDYFAFPCSQMAERVFYRPLVLSHRACKLLVI